MARKIQTFIFSKGEGDWTVEKATKWLDDHSFRSDKVDDNDSSWRFRQFDPEKCDRDSFKTLTENFPAGVEAVSCEVSSDAGAKPAAAKTPAEAPAVVVKKDFREAWQEAGRDPRELRQVGRELAELLGEPALAERVLVRKEVVAKVAEPAAATKDAGDENLDLDVTVSSDEEDRARDVIHQDGWDLSIYRVYPVVLLGHQYDNPARNIVGKNVKIGFAKKSGVTSMVGLDRLMPDDVGRRLHGLAKFVGALGVSVGFNPGEWDFRKNEDGDIVGFDFIEQEKLEHSIVTIPCLRSGMATAVSKGLVVDRFLPLIAIGELEKDEKEAPATSASGLVAAVRELNAALALRNVNALVEGNRRDRS